MTGAKRAKKNIKNGGKYNTFKMHKEKDFSLFKKNGLNLEVKNRKKEQEKTFKQ